MSSLSDSQGQYNVSTCLYASVMFSQKQPHQAEENELNRQQGGKKKKKNGRK